MEQLCDSVANKSDDVTDAGSDNDGWTGLAYPFQTGGGMVDAVTFTLNTNRAGGDIWIVGNIADPTPPPDTTCGQPDITNVLAVICCALEELPPDTGGPNPVPIIHTVNFPPGHDLGGRAHLGHLRGPDGSRRTQRPRR